MHRGLLHLYVMLDMNHTVASHAMLISSAPYHGHDAAPRHALPILSMFVVPQRLQLTRNGMRGAGFANSHTVQPELIFRSRVTTFANESDWSPM